MSDKIYLGDAAEDITISPTFIPYSKIVVVAGEDDEGKQIVYEAGNDENGKTIEVTNPLLISMQANEAQKIVNDMLARINGYRYRPFTAENALLYPAAELGDAITVGGAYSVYATEDISFGLFAQSSISAPQNDEEDDEYPYKSEAVKQIERRLKGIRTSLTIQTGEIKASIEDLDRGLSSTITQTAACIRSEVNDTASKINSSITQTATTIYAEVNRQTSEINKSVSKIQMNANNISLLVSEVFPNGTNANSSITLMSNRISSVVKEVWGKDSVSGNSRLDSDEARLTSAESSITQTSNKIESIVKEVWTDGNMNANSRITQTAASIEAAVSGKVDEATVKNMINISLNGITLSATAGQNQSTIRIMANGIVVDSAVVKFSNIVANNIVANSSITSPKIFTPYGSGVFYTSDRSDVSSPTFIMAKTESAFSDDISYALFEVSDDNAGTASLLIGGNVILSKDLNFNDITPRGIWNFGAHAANLCVNWGYSEPNYSGQTGEVYFVVE